MARLSLTASAGGVTVGVDTHGEVHVAAAFTSDLGRPLGHLEIATTPRGIANFFVGPTHSAHLCSSGSKELDRSASA
jgi:hypothetical protein